jgi:hypothetical protein
MVKRLLVPSSALLWGLQLAFLSPALALILTNLYGATTAEVGWVLGIYNAGGFVASLAARLRRQEAQPSGPDAGLRCADVSARSHARPGDLATGRHHHPSRDRRTRRGWAARCSSPTFAIPEPDPPISSTPARSCQAQRAVLPPRPDRDQLPGGHRLLPGTGAFVTGPVLLIGLQLLNAGPSPASPASGCPCSST